jgi:dienelactone hydrolase
MLTRVAVFVACALLGGVPTVSAQVALDNALDAYWRAANPKDAAKVAEQVVKSGADFDAVASRLKQGRTYKTEKTGTLLFRSPGVSGTFETRVDIPADYNPASKIPLRVQLHGGVTREQSDEDRPAGRGGQTVSNRIPGEPQIYVQPGGWAGAPWWSAAQVDNIVRVVDQLSRRYNIDESQVYLTGISDGGTGCYYIGTHDATRWATVMPLNGSIVVLRSPATGTDGEVYPNNLVNTPLYVVNGGRDPLYPVSDVTTHIAWFRDLGVTLSFRPQPQAGHDTSWWPTERASYETFLHEHPRQPHPTMVSWETERTDRFNREKWLVIDKLGAGVSDTAITDAGFFRHTRPSGRVDVERRGNDFVARTRGVKEFRLLLSPDVVDFTRTVRVVVNGREIFSGSVEKDVGVLMAWHARDNDRTMLYGAELRIVVP